MSGTQMAFAALCMPVNNSIVAWVFIWAVTNFSEELNSYLWIVRIDCICYSLD